MHTADSPTVIDLFCGAGGIAEGFRQEGFVSIAASDNDPDACATFRRNFPGAAVIHGDIRDRNIQAQILEAGKRASIVVGGPPCQAFSQVRNHTRIIDDPRNSLYKEFVNIVARVEPLAFVMENVTGIDQMGFREQIAADLELAGEYRVRPQVVDAADVGAPQTRKRLLFVGVKRSLGIDPPWLQHSGASASLALTRTVNRGRTKYVIDAQGDYIAGQVLDHLTDPEDLIAVSAEQALSDLLSLQPGNREDELPYASIGAPNSAYQRLMREGAAELLSNVQVPRLRDDTATRLRAIPPGGNHRDLPEELTKRNLSADRWGPENGSGLLSRLHFYAYRRLHPSIWSWTLNTKADCVYHYKEIRGLSVREFARLHSFPDRFVFTTDKRPGLLPGRHDGGSAHSRYRQVGNAVPPLLARACASALRRSVFSALDQPVLAAA